MTAEQFISLFQYLCNVFWSFFLIIYRIPLTKNVCFGQVLIVALIFFLVIYFIIRPLNRD